MVKAHLCNLDKAREAVELRVRRRRFRQWCQRQNLDRLVAGTTVPEDLDMTLSASYNRLCAFLDYDGVVHEFGKDDWLYFWEDESELQRALRGEQTDEGCSKCMGKWCKPPTIRQKDDYWSCQGCTPFAKYFGDRYVWEKRCIDRYTRSEWEKSRDGNN
jgi:hypothetical protein